MDDYQMTVTMRTVAYLINYSRLLLTADRVCRRLRVRSEICEIGYNK